MNQHERDMVGRALTEAAIFYDRPDFDKSRISILVSSFATFFPEANAETILKALETYRNDEKNGNFFPSPARLQKYLRPQVSVDAQAQEIAGRITQSISKFGYTGHEDAKAFIGEIGWTVVHRFGGWAHICREHGVSLNPGQFFAQSRDLIKSQIEIAKSGIPVDNLLEYQEKKSLGAPDVKGLIATMLEKNKMPLEEK